MWKVFNNISDKRLSLLLALCIPAGILLLFLPVTLISIGQIVTQGETQYTEIEIQRTERILEQKTKNLNQTLNDWSAWDETFQFAQVGNPDYE